MFILQFFCAWTRWSWKQRFWFSSLRNAACISLVPAKVLTPARVLAATRISDTTIAFTGSTHLISGGQLLWAAGKSYLYFVCKSWHLWNNLNLEHSRKLPMPINTHCQWTAQCTTIYFRLSVYGCNYNHTNSFNSKWRMNITKSVCKRKDTYLNVIYSDKIWPLRIVLYKASYTTAFLWPHGIAICCIYLNNCWRHRLERRSSDYF